MNLRTTSPGWRGELARKFEAERLREKGQAMSETSNPSSTPAREQEAELRVLMREVLDKGLIYWEPNTDRGYVAKADMVARCEAALASAGKPGADAVDFQARTGDWVLACFGDEIACDELERMDRFLEEVFEALQARDYPKDRIAALREYVWSRPAGIIDQEAGGVMMTFAAWCRVIPLNMHAAGETELTRVWGKVDQIRAKQAAKPKHSPLPEPRP